MTTDVEPDFAAGMHVAMDNTLAPDISTFAPRLINAAGTGLLHGELDPATEYRRLRDRAVVEAVVRTLRYISLWGDEDRSADALRVVADHVEQAHAAGEIADWCCPVCEEITCDGDCPLEEVREHG